MRQGTLTTIDEDVIDRLRHAAKGMDFGTILVEVYDGRVVSVEAAPNKRFVLVAKYNEGGGI
jgi:hypothetical protein